MINQQADSWCLGGILCIEMDTSCFFLFLLFLEQLLIEFDEKQSLVADVREEVVLPNEVENVGPSQPQEELECLARLTVRNVPGVGLIGVSRCMRSNSHSSARHSMRIVVSGPLEPTFDDDGALSNSASSATMTEGMS